MMVQGHEEQPQAKGVDVRDKQPASPNGSTSSREEHDARERLKKASITGLSQIAQTDSATSNTEPHLQPDSMDSVSATNNGARGRPAKKRSFEDLVKDDTETNDSGSLGQPPLPKSGHHKRMRSRDIASGDHSNAYNKIEGDLNDTLHEETDVDAQKSPGGPGVLVDVPSQEEMEKDLPSQTQEIPTDSTGEEKPSSTSLQAPSTSTTSAGFANTSTASPFGRAKSPIAENPTPKSPSDITSTSAFASSGLSAFASSVNSPFGSAGSKPASGFGGTTTVSGFGSSKGGFGSSSGFSTTGTSGFGGGMSSNSSAFGAPRMAGSAFGTPKPFGSTSAIGSGNPSSAFGVPKPFGASSTKEDDEDEAGNEDDEASSSVANDDVKQDPRFHDQHVDTGEEHEEVHFSARAKLYVFAGKDGWKDRGTGVFKINVSTDSNELPETDDLEAQPQSVESGRRKARLLMRADATHRVILNSPVFRGMRFGNPDGSEPNGKLMHLQSFEEGKPTALQIKMGKEEVLKDLYHRLRELEQEARSLTQ